MNHDSLDAFVDATKGRFSKGPTALVMAEDSVDLAATLNHHLKIGFATVAALCPAEIPLPPEFEATVHRVAYDVHADESLPNAVNKVIEAAPGAWFYYCYNAEYLLFPFCETRSVREMLAFHTEERRDAMLTYVIDLYASDLDKHGNAVDRASALLDRSGYYALGRGD
ncbi:MAG: hypothetical protein Q7J57_14895, partial [Gemmobacter sp.]|nr:hypothetical protein [Gemmobacter sp.]